MKRLFLAIPLTLVALGACESSNSGMGVVRFALDDGSSHFRLRIFSATPEAGLTGTAVFDTGCLAQLSKTYELSNIPVGEGYAIIYEGFPSAPCAAEARQAVGFRGGVAVTTAPAPYLHLQVYRVGASTALPEDLNLSASTARSVEFCAVDDDCSGARDLCFDDAAPSYWCVPTCAADTDCTSIHPRATCELDTGWCMLLSPYPLNMSEPRAFGAAATLDDGDVLLVGGLEQEGLATAGANASYVSTTHTLERFDAATGLFGAVPLTGDEASPGGAFGFAALGGDRFVAVGGLSRAELGWAEGLEVEASFSTALLPQIIVWDLSAGKVKLSPLGQGQALGSAVPLDADSFIVIGGVSPASGAAEPRKSTLVCDIAADLSVTCRGGPNLSVGRMAPATLCLDAACDRILVLGGNATGALAEVIERSQNASTPLTTRGLPERVFSPVLCGFDLVAGSLDLQRSTPTAAVRLTLQGTTLEGNPLSGSPMTSVHVATSGATSAFGSGQTCHLAGGVSGATPSADIVRVGSSRFDVKASLVRHRLGAQAAVIGSGPIAGYVLVAGGVARDGAGRSLLPVRGAEVYAP